MARLSGVVARALGARGRARRVVLVLMVMLPSGPGVLPLFHRLRRVAEDLEPDNGVRERRTVVHAPRDAWRQGGLDEARQQLRDLSQPIQLLPRDGQHAEAHPIAAGVG